MDGGCRPPRAVTFDYWLCRCQGFQVDSPEGRVGFVEEVRFRSRVDRPDALAVRAGLVGRHLLIVPVDEVVDIAPRDERIVLRSMPPLKGRLKIPRLAAGRRRRRSVASGSSEASVGATPLGAQAHTHRSNHRDGREVRMMAPEAEEPAEAVTEETAEAPAAEETAEAPAAEETVEAPVAEASETTG